MNKRALTLHPTISSSMFALLAQNCARWSYPAFLLFACTTVVNILLYTVLSSVFWVSSDDWNFKGACYLIGTLCSQATYPLVVVVFAHCILF